MGLESTVFIKLNVKHVWKKKRPLNLNRESDSYFTTKLILMGLYILISKGVGVVNSRPYSTVTFWGCMETLRPRDCEQQLQEEWEKERCLGETNGKHMVWMISSRKKGVGSGSGVADEAFNSPEVNFPNSRLSTGTKHRTPITYVFIALQRGAIYNHLCWLSNAPLK